MSLLSILVINIVLSGDNAVVIALASRRLPVNLQRKAIIFGSMGAIVLRVMLTTVAVFLLKIPFLKLAGGVLLIWIAVKLLKDEDGEEKINESSNLLKAIETIIIADFLMSLDNVLGVAAAARGDILLLIIGLTISIPIIASGSGIIMKLMEKVPVLVHVGAAILGFTAGEMIIEEKIVEQLVNSEILAPAIPLAIAVGVILPDLIRRFRGVRLAKAANENDQAASQDYED